MRRANNSQFLFTGNVLLGVNLGADYVSEHEWGIKEIKQFFGIPSGPKDWGIARRKITTGPDALTFGWTTGYDGKGEGFYLLRSWEGKKPSFAKNHELYQHRHPLACAWDGGSFGVFSTSPEEIEHLKTIYDAFLELDGVIFLGGGGVFQNSGLVLGIASRIPKKFIDGWYWGDKDHYELDQEVEATGIRQLLKDKGKRYHALSPSRQEDGSIRYWLNPQEQQANKAGWYTLEDLKEWDESKGRIPTKGRKTA